MLRTKSSVLPPCFHSPLVRSGARPPLAVSPWQAEQFRRKSPDAPARLQYAELLILAGRRAEAVPILLGLADEYLRFGFVDKAKDALGRIEQLESGRADVALRLRRIAGLEQTPAEPRLDGKSRRAAKDVRPAPSTAVEGPVQGSHEPRDEPAPSREWETDLSAPIAMDLELPPPDREEPVDPMEVPVEVDPEPIAATPDLSEWGNTIHVELTGLDFFPMGDGVLVNPPGQKSGSSRS